MVGAAVGMMGQDSGRWSPASPSALRACVLVLPWPTLWFELAVGNSETGLGRWSWRPGFAAPQGHPGCSLSCGCRAFGAQVVLAVGILRRPLGIGLGAALAESAGPLPPAGPVCARGAWHSWHLLYITFLELLPQELASLNKDPQGQTCSKQALPLHWPAFTPI